MATGIVGPERSVPMSAIAIAPVPATAAARPRRLEVQTTGRDDVLVRVLTLLRQRWPAFFPLV